MSDDILFAEVNLPILDKEIAAREIFDIRKEFWFWDDYRATNMLPLMTKGSLAGKLGAHNNREGDFNWVPYAPEIIKNWFEEVVFPWMGQRTRIMALLTRPYFENKEHIDCQLPEIGQRQHKFRIVLQGRTDTLYFITKSGEVPAPRIDGSFVMDGGWPHGMNNSDDIFKLTIAAGAPWNGLDCYDNVNILMRRGEHELPVIEDRWLNK